MHGYMIVVYPSRIGYTYSDMKPECRLPDNMPLPCVEPVKRPRASYAKKAAGKPKEPAPCDERSADEDDEPPSDDVKSESDSSVESETSDTSLTEWRARQSQQMDPSSSSKQV